MANSNLWNWLLPYPKGDNSNWQQHKAAYEVVTPKGDLRTRIDYHQERWANNNIFTPIGAPEYGISNEQVLEFKGLLNAENAVYNGISTEDESDTRIVYGGSGSPVIADRDNWWTSVQIDFASSEQEPRKRLGGGSVQRAGWFSWLNNGHGEPSEFLSLPGQFSTPRCGRSRGLWIWLEPGVQASLRFTRLRGNNLATSWYQGVNIFPTFSKYWIEDAGYL